MKRTIRYVLSAVIVAAQAFSCEPIDPADPPVDETPGQEQEPGTGETPGQGEEPGQGEQGGTQTPQPSPAFYQTVTQEYTDWSGDYLIAYSTSSSIDVFNSWTGTDKGASTVDLASKYGADGIPAADGDPYKAVIAKVGEGYSIYVTGVGYIGCESSSNTLSKQDAAPTATDTKYLWKLSYKSGIGSVMLHIVRAGCSGMPMLRSSAAIQAVRKRSLCTEGHLLRAVL